MNYFFFKMSVFLARISEKMWGSSPSGPGARATQFLDDYYSGNGQQSTDHGHQRWDICHSEIHHKMCLISTLLTTGFLPSKLFTSANFQPNQKRRPRPRLLGCLRPLHLDAEHLCWHWKQQSLLWLLQQILKWNQLRQYEYIPFSNFCHQRTEWTFVQPGNNFSASSTTINRPGSGLGTHFINGFYTASLIFHEVRLIFFPGTRDWRGAYRVPVSSQEVKSHICPKWLQRVSM